MSQIFLPPNNYHSFSGLLEPRLTGYDLKVFGRTSFHITDATPIFQCPVLWNMGISGGQMGCAEVRRLLNIKNNMEADGQIVKDRVVIVLDDVYTTLATFSEAERALHLSGTRSVYGIFIAH